MYKYKNYPGFPALTTKSRFIGLFTSGCFVLLIYSWFWWIIIWQTLTSFIEPSQFLAWLTLLSLALLYILLLCIRKRAFEKLDRQYIEELTKNRENTSSSPAK